MAEQLARMLRETLDRELPLLRELGDEMPGGGTGGETWSRKEELGHLLDSATNNRVRFVRASLEPAFTGPSYDQDGWVRLHAYNDLPWTWLVSFWESYNTLLVQLIGQLDDSRLQTQCTIGSSAPVTLAFLIEDYILHMQHHLDHILRREKITTYPGAAAGV